MKKFTLIFLILFVIFAGGCGKDAKVRTGTAQELYNDATNELYNNKGGFPWVFTGPDYDYILNILKEIQLRDKDCRYILQTGRIPAGNNRVRSVY